MEEIEEEIDFNSTKVQFGGALHRPLLDLVMPISIPLRYNLEGGCAAQGFVHFLFQFH